MASNIFKIAFQTFLWNKIDSETKNCIIKKKIMKKESNTVSWNFRKLHVETKQGPNWKICSVHLSIKYLYVPEKLLFWYETHWWTRQKLKRSFFLRFTETNEISLSWDHHKSKKIFFAIHIFTCLWRFYKQNFRYTTIIFKILEKNIKKSRPPLGIEPPMLDVMWRFPTTVFEKKKFHFG